MLLTKALKNGKNKKGWFFTTLFVLVMMLSLTGCKGKDKEDEKDGLTILLVRHARTVANEEGVIMGGKSESELSEEGVKQAEELGEKIKDVHLDAVYTSELKRTKETARIALLKNAFGCKRVYTDPGLNDIDLGLYEGKKAEDLVPVYGDDFIGNGIGDITDSSFESPAKCESAYDFTERFKGALDNIAESELYRGSDTIMVVAHSSAIYFLKKVLDSPSSLGDHLDNASLTVLKYKDGNYYLLNDFDMEN